MRKFLFKVIASPNVDSAKTNKVYLSPRDPNLSALTDYAYLKVNNFIFQWETSSNGVINPGEISFNSVQRKFLNLALKDTVEVNVLSGDKIPYSANMSIEVDYFVPSSSQCVLENSEFSTFILKMFSKDVFTVTQKVLVEYKGTTLVYEIKDITILESQEKKGNYALISSNQARIINDTKILLSSRNSFIRITGSSAPVNIFKPDFNFDNLGIGGLDKEFGTIFRRAFASRVFPPSVMNKLGINPVKGLLLYGPPGCGKTLMARKIGKMLNGKEPKIVNGPEILSKFVGQSEENIRNLFKEAEDEWREKGDQSEIHIIVMDELDAICKERGSRVQGGTGVGDSIVNQLLSKMDGYDRINNLLIIGMTNRKDMIDEALLRPGRLEVHIEISIPDKNGRYQILKIHTAQMSKSGMLDARVDLQELAENTKNYSGAELEGLVRTAASYALNRQIDFKNPTHPSDPEKVMVLFEDFEMALQETHPAYGISDQELNQNVQNGVINYSSEFENLIKQCILFVKQVKNSERTPLVSILLEGHHGCGKTAISSKLGLDSLFPFVQIISPESMVGSSESRKVSLITSTFEAAYRSPLSFIIVDDIERLIEYVPIGPRFSNIILQTLIVLIKKLPPKNTKMFVVTTSSDSRLLNDLGILRSLNYVLTIPNVCTNEGFQKVLKSCNYTDSEMQEIFDVDLRIPKDGIPVKKLIMVAEMAKQAESDQGLAKRFAMCFNQVVEDQS